MIDYSGPIFDEIRNLLQNFTDMDPDGEWDYSKWELYAKENASEKLKKYIKRKGKYWFYAKPKRDGVM